MNESLQKALYNYIQDPLNDIFNFDIGFEYHKIGQKAAALSYFLRTAEITQNSHLAYEALLLNAQNFRQQGKRDNSALNQLLHAIALVPSRPEAYFLLSRYYEETQKWHESFTIAEMGLKMADFNSPPFRTFNTVEYPGKYGLIFQKAIAAWWIDRPEYTRQLLRGLLNDYAMEDKYANTCRYNLEKIGGELYPILRYGNWYHRKLRYKFKGSEKIQQNYSQVYQDMFVLSMLDGKKEGTYVEIGSAEPFHNNNTALLEKDFEWKGISVDYNMEKVKEFESQRSNPVYYGDATDADYVTLFKQANFPKHIDYLQLDCEPADITYKALELIPFDQYKFATITYEHDYYADSEKKYRDLSRKFLTEKGYILIADNISPDKNSSFEDWWVHPELVDSSIIEKMTCVDNTVKRADQYMLNDL